MVSTDQQRRELATFIRSRRERRTPREAGLTEVGRRRTPGLRREEVATIAGVSITWYTWLEQAREIKVSRQVLGSLGRALGLDEVETAHLFRLAGEVPPTSTLPSQPVLPPQYQMLLRQLDPNPAYIVNRRFDILAWNRGCESLLGELTCFPPGRRNVLWLTFTSPEFRRMSENWEQDAAYTVALFRAQCGEGVLQPEVAELVADVAAHSEEFSRLWQLRDLAPFVPQRRPVNHPRLGRIELEYLKMHAAGDDKTLVAFLAPHGSALYRRLAELVDQP